jgi:hypothetical protein
MTRDLSPARGPLPGPHVEDKHKAMDTMAESIAGNLKRVNALLTWWGIPNVNGIGAATVQIKRFQKLAADLQAMYGEASRLQLKTLLAANEEMARTFSEMLRVRAMKDLVGAESSLIANLSENLSLQTKTWTQMSEKLNEFARQTAEEIKQQNKDPHPTSKAA